MDTSFDTLEGDIVWEEAPVSSQAVVRADTASAWVANDVDGPREEAAVGRVAVENEEERIKRARYAADEDASVAAAHAARLAALQSLQREQCAAPSPVRCNDEAALPVMARSTNVIAPSSWGLPRRCGSFEATSVNAGRKRPRTAVDTGAGVDALSPDSPRDVHGVLSLMRTIQSAFCQRHGLDSERERAAFALARVHTHGDADAGSPAVQTAAETSPAHIGRRASIESVPMTTRRTPRSSPLTAAARHLRRVASGVVSQMSTARARPTAQLGLERTEVSDFGGGASQPPGDVVLQVLQRVEQSVLGSHVNGTRGDDASSSRALHFESPGMRVPQDTRDVFVDGDDDAFPAEALQLLEEIEASVLQTSGGAASAMDVPAPRAVETRTAALPAAVNEFGDDALDEGALHALDDIETSSILRRNSSMQTDARAHSTIAPEAWDTDIDDTVLAQALDTAVAARNHLQWSQEPCVSWRDTLGAIGDATQLVPAGMQLPASASRLPAFFRAVIVAVSAAHDARVTMSGPWATIQQQRFLVVRGAAWSRRCGDASDIVAGVAELHVCVVVRDEWLRAPVQPGDVVHLVATASGRVSRLQQLQQLSETSAPDAMDPRLTLLQAQAMQACVQPHAVLGVAFVPQLVVMMDSVRNAMIVSPDVLLPPTRISRSFTCMRRAVLSEVMGDAGAPLGYSPIALLGQLKHLLFQHGMMIMTDAERYRALADVRGCVTAAGLQSALIEYAKAMVHRPQHMTSLLAARVPDTQALAMLVAVVPAVSDWLLRCVLPPDETPSAALDKYMDRVRRSGSDVKHLPPFLVRQLVGIEDSMWSPVWGLRGVIDATVDILVVPPALRRGPLRQADVAYDGMWPALRVPFELKTGKPPMHGSFNSDHRAQLAVYALLMADRYGDMAAHMQGIHVNAGVLPTPSIDKNVHPGVTFDFEAFERTVGTGEAELLEAAATQVGGILVYLGTGGPAPSDGRPSLMHHTASIPILWIEQRTLLVARSSLAAGLMHARVAAAAFSSGVEDTAAPRLPALEQSSRICGSCECFAGCMALYATGELPCTAQPQAAVFGDGSRVPSVAELHVSVRDMYASAVQAVQGATGEYLRRWMRLVDVESAAAASSKWRPHLGAREETAAERSPSGDIEDVAGGTCPAVMYGTRSRMWLLSSGDRVLLGVAACGLGLVKQQAYSYRVAPPTTTSQDAAVQDVMNGNSRASLFTSQDDESRASDVARYSADASQQRSRAPSVDERVRAEEIDGDVLEQSDEDNVYEYTFAVLPNTVGMSLLECGLDAGSFVTASCDDSIAGPYALLQGIVLRKSAAEIVVRGHRDARAAFPHAFMHAASPPFAWRLDVDELGNSVRVVKDNLVRLALGVGREPDAAVGGRVGDQPVADPRDGLVLPPGFGHGDVRCQEWVVHCRAPRFASGLRFPWEKPPHRDAGVNVFQLQQLQSEFRTTLNEHQQEAVSRILRMEDYSLVLGMPGTGKTSTIALAIRCLLASGKSVLVSSHTHSAVDTLLLKLQSDKVDFLRLGRPEQVHPSLRSATLEAGIGDGRLCTVGHVIDRVKSARVVAVTCLGVLHAALLERRFDVVIIDEAGQIPEPVALGPLRLGHTFVLIGDHYQLPPLVVSPVAKAAGMGVSLFQRLCELHPCAVVPLRLQYRMNEDVQVLPNKLVYAGALLCGSPAVATRRYVLTKLDRLPPLRAAEAAAGLDWIRVVLNPSTTVVFLNTDALGSPVNGVVDPVTGVSYHESRLNVTQLQQLDGTSGAAAAGASAAPATFARVIGATTRRAAGVVHDAQGDDDDDEFAAALPHIDVLPTQLDVVDLGAHVGSAAINTAASATPSVKSSNQPGQPGGGGLVNRPEASVVAMLVQAIVRAGGRASDIGVMAPFRSQLRLIRTLLDWLAQQSQYPVPHGSGASARHLSRVEVDTVDRFQGKDKDIVIVSMTRSNAAGHTGMLLQDRARLNVALTRAKSKLVLIGSKSTLARGSPIMAQLIDVLEAHSWMMSLPAGAHQDCYRPPLDMPWKRLEGRAGHTDSDAAAARRASTVTGVALDVAPELPAATSTPSADGIMRKRLGARRSVRVV